MEHYYPTIALFSAIALFFAGAAIKERLKPSPPEAEASADPSPPLPADEGTPAKPQARPVEDLFDGGAGEDVWGDDDPAPARGPGYHTYRPSSAPRDEWQ